MTAFPNPKFFKMRLADRKECAAKIFHVAIQQQGWVGFSRNLLSRDCLTNSSPFEKLSLSQRSDWLREKEKRYLKQIDSGNHWLVGAVHILCWHWWLDQLLTTKNFRQMWDKFIVGLNLILVFILLSTLLLQCQKFCLFEPEVGALYRCVLCITALWI